MSLGAIQRVIYDCYTDCVKRTKKKANLGYDVVYFMLDTCSIRKSYWNKSYSKTSEAVSLICHRLCHGQWCTRSHCKEHSLHYAYHCKKTRPSVCKEYKAYIDKKKLHEEEKGGENERTRS